MHSGPTITLLRVLFIVFTGFLGQPRFVDYDLWGMLANYLYSGHYKLPAAHLRLKNWFGRLARLAKPSREKLRT